MAAANKSASSKTPAKSAKTRRTRRTGRREHHKQRADIGG